jgi:Phytanoyl-CoA dioxygenase (PhyH)
VLTADQQATFERWGMVRLRAAFSERAARRMRDVIWNELAHRYGVRRDRPDTWDRHPPTGLKSSKRSAAFAPIISETVADAVDGLLGPGRWERPRHLGNVLVTMPNATEWRVPHRIWHADFEATEPADELFAVKLWALVDDVEPGGGGTPQLLGSHRLFARFLDGRADLDYKRCKIGFLASHPALKALATDDGSPDRNERLSREVDVDGLPARVVECTGQAGDVFVTHPWLFHSIAVNASRRPRLMRSVAIRRTVV